MDLKQSGDRTNGDDDRVENNCRPSQSHMQSAVASRHEAALQQEKDHPAGHESAVNIHDRGSLMCYWLCCIVQAMHVKHQAMHVKHAKADATLAIINTQAIR
jgi:hypothetical protein